MSDAASKYREPKVQDDDEDDLDDLDASFSAPAKPAQTKLPDTTSPAASSGPSARPASNDASASGNDEDFEASLVEGMESLLRQLAGDHPPGPMPGETQKGKGPGAGLAAGDGGDLSKEEEEAAWQRAIEMMLSGEGLDALGLDKDGQPKNPPRSPPPLPGSGAKLGEAKPSFDETIRKTMEQLQNPQAKSSASGSDGPDFAALLAQLGSDPSALDGLDEDGDGLGGILDGMMAQLMTKEVLEEPMSELASKYPAYLESPPAGTNPDDLEKYKQQYKIVSSILETFRKPGYTDEKDGKEVARLVGEMQDLGGPPQEIMGDLPEGFDLGALGNLGSDDGCTIM